MQADESAKRKWEQKCTENAQLAYAHAAELDRVNNARKTLQSQMVNEALERAHSLPEDSAVTIVDMKGWHPGVIGIVAGRLKDRFEKPSIVIGVNEEGLGKGSGRSIKGVNLGEAITQAKEAGLLAQARKNLSLKIDALIAPGTATQALIDKIDQVGPYGAGNRPAKG